MLKNFQRLPTVVVFELLIVCPISNRVLEQVFPLSTCVHNIYLVKHVKDACLKKPHCNTMIEGFEGFNLVYINIWF